MKVIRSAANVATSATIRMAHPGRTGRPAWRRSPARRASHTSTAPCRTATTFASAPASTPSSASPPACAARSTPARRRGSNRRRCGTVDPEEGEPEGRAVAPSTTAAAPARRVRPHNRMAPSTPTRRVASDPEQGCAPGRRVGPAPATIRQPIASDSATFRSRARPVEGKRRERHERPATLSQAAERRARVVADASRVVSAPPACARCATSSATSSRTGRSPAISSRFHQRRAARR